MFNCNRHLQKAGLLNQELCKIEMFQLNFETLSYEANIIAQQWLNNVKHLQDFRLSTENFLLQTKQSSNELDIIKNIFICCHFLS